MKEIVISQKGARIRRPRAQNVRESSTTVSDPVSLGRSARESLAR